MEDAVASSVNAFIEYGIVGLGWPLFLYALYDHRKAAEQEKRRAQEQRNHDIELIERIIAQTVENTLVLQQLTKVIESARTE